MLAKDTLDERIVRELAASSGHTAKELHERITKSGTRYTLRGVYKELAKLEQLEIVYRVEQKYSLRLAWVMSLLNFADSAYDTYTNPAYLTQLFRSAEEKLVHRFSNLQKLDACWIQMIMALQQLYPKRATCLWCPYQWFYLVHDFTTARFYRSEEDAKVKRFHIIGNDTFLDRQALLELPKSGAYSFAQGPFHEQRTCYYSLIGEHIITVKLDHAITRKIDALFAKVTDEYTLKREEVREVFSSRVRASLTVEVHEKKATRMRKQFSEYFGTSIE